MCVCLRMQASGEQAGFEGGTPTLSLERSEGKE